MSLAIERLKLSLSNRPVVKDVTLKVDPGEVVGLLGPNGAGKTTTFNMIVGLLKPNFGKIFLEKNCINNFPMTTRVHLGIGYLAQEPSIFRNLTVKQNLEIAFSQSSMSKSLCRKRREELIEEFNLISFIDRYGYQLSGGERRRCELARALAVSCLGPKYLLLDEPFAGIDPIAINDLQNLIGRLKNKNIGILITDHNVRATLAITDHSYILSKGEILAHGSSDQLTGNQIVKENYLGNSFDS